MFAADKQFITDHLQDNIRNLALKLRSLSTDLDAPLIIRQIAGRQAVKRKIPLWYENDELLYPEHLPMEQCSSQWTAIYKASLLKGSSLVDLTGGFGVDCAFIAPNFEQVFYVERQVPLCTLATHNFDILGLPNIKVVQAESEDFLQKMDPVDCIYLDPARRNENGSKTVYLSDCEPDITLLKNQMLEKADTVLVKLSPMLDISLALQSLPETHEVHIVSVENECKELLFLLRKNSINEPRIYCVNMDKKGIPEKIEFLRSEEQAIIPPYTSSLGKYLYEPNVSILKAGGYKIPTTHYPVTKLHPDSHLYTSDELVSDFPGRAFQVQSVFSFSKKDLKANLADISQAHITVRNFPASVDEIRKKIKIAPGGDTYLFATTLQNGEKVLICCKK